MPLHFIRLFQSVCKNAGAIYTHNGKSRTLLMFFFGVLEGCPASASVFNNAIDPFLANFDNTLRAHNAGIVRACAHDIGITLIRLKRLQYILYIVITKILVA